MNINSKVVVGLVSALSIAAIGLLSSKIRAQEVAFEQLRHEGTRLQRLETENVRLRSVVIDPGEIERLRRETAVLLKLRNEFGKLTSSNQDSTVLQASMEELLGEREEILAEEKEIHQLSERAACIKNLEQIASAKKRWASDNAAERGLPVVLESLMDYLPGKAAPVCPSGGHYSVNRLGAPPACSIEGHAVP